MRICSRVSVVYFFFCGISFILFTHSVLHETTVYPVAQQNDTSGGYYEGCNVFGEERGHGLFTSSWFEHQWQSAGSGDYR